MSSSEVGAARSAPERAFLECFAVLERTLSEHADELEPYQERNAIKALAALRQIASGLDADPPYLYEIETPRDART